MQKFAAQLLLGTALGSVMMAQRGGSDWMTAGFDAQRSHWVRSDAKISPESLSKPGFDLVWKMKLNTVTPPSLLDFYIGYRGFRTLGFFGGAANRAVGVDTDLGRLEWERPFGKAAAGTAKCPGGLTAAVTRPTNTAYPADFGGRGAGRGTPAKSDVGEPHEGASLLKSIANRPAPPPRPAPAKPTGPPEANPFAPRVQYALALDAEGKLHTMWVSNGNEDRDSKPFLPPGANASGLIAFDNFAYAATSGSCGGAPNGLWAMDVGSGKVSSWKSQNDIAGDAGPAAGPDGKLYIATGDQVVALAPKTLETLAIYKAGAPMATSPVVFDYKGRNLLAVASKDGSVHLLDTASLSSGLAKTPAKGGISGGGLASWQDRAGVRWILAATSNTITTWKIADKHGALSLEGGWTSRVLESPRTPVIVNGVVFALSAGAPNNRAVLYALDALSGKELWSSGSMMSAQSRGGLSAGGSRVYVATADGIQYAFGFPIEH